MLCLFISMNVTAQSSKSIGVSALIQSYNTYGASASFELNKFQNEDFSLPLSANLSFYNYNGQFNTLNLDVERGYRKYFNDKQLFVEQSFALGVLFSFYDSPTWTELEDGVMCIPIMDWELILLQ